MDWLKDKFNAAMILANDFLDEDKDFIIYTISDHNIMRPIGNGQQVIKITIEFAPIESVTKEKWRPG